MFEINNKVWRIKAVLRNFSPLTRSVHAVTPTPQAGWTTRTLLTHDEIQPSSRWMHFQAPRPTHQVCPLIRKAPIVRIGEQRGWIDPAP